ncbi:MAG TPA: HAD family hydrolase [Candidatus Hydrogenedentes bacterium]|jgi:putative hydrolase of the HAD superfamily|nr:MAG: flavin mononucleotide phosphatase [Candidatus Hydrogenedentes bacterium ADurb.Bin170]HQB03521.1 HAD family hydrolase [Candidatus Hydrogenedentota bacterium]
MYIRAVTFDFWGTLFRDAQGEERHGLRLRGLVEATGAPEQDADRALRRTMAFFMRNHLDTQHTLTPHDAAQLCCRQLNVHADETILKQLAQCFGDAILQYPPVPIDRALDAVRVASERVPVALISDTGFSPGRNLRILLDNAGFLSYFSALNFSDETGAAKPQRRMYVSIADRLGIAPHELLHIGDLEPTDITGAHQVHAKAALITAVNARYAGSTRADYLLPSWDRFLELVPRLL